MFPKGGARKRQKNLLLPNFQGGKISPPFYFILPTATYNSKIRVTEKRNRKKE
jgi:hypothetical protein